MSKKKTKFRMSSKDKRNIFLAAIGGVLLAGIWLYFMFVKPISPDGRIAAVAVANAAENPDSSEVKKVIDSGKAVRLSLAGCPNLCKVTDTLYRGAQPTKEGFDNLKKLGIKTVINLRDHHTDMELMTPGDFQYVPIPVDVTDVSAKTILQFLKAAADPNAAPVFVHCQHGADRTGVMVAAYRSVVMEWDISKAIWEMTHGGYGYHPMWVELPVTLRSLKVQELGKQIKK